MGYIYVLLLEDQKYYVGYSDNPVNRIDQHFNSCGSKWTMKYPVKKVLKVENGTKKDEAIITREMMRRHGIDNVRGGPWCNIILHDDPFNYNSELYGDHINDRCYNCGRYGHYINECHASKELRCYKCNKRGHYASECYSNQKLKNKSKDTEQVHYRNMKSKNKSDNCNFEENITMIVNFIGDKFSQLFK